MHFSRITLKFLPLLLTLILIEAWIIVIRNKQAYPWQESLVSLAIAVGHRLSQLVPLYGIFQLAWNYRLMTISLNHWWNLVLLFMGIEFFYYWYHRTSHQVRWFWASHMVHHSTENFNLTSAYRLGWTSAISGSSLFFVPLAWLGFEPSAILIGLALNLIYQFWIHTELVPQLGPLELVLNTPSHHRVHHAANDEYIDRNYGGVLIIFDRLFGTYAAEQSAIKIKYGLTHPIKSNNPLAIALHEWMEIGKDIISANSWTERLCYIFASPSWKFHR